MKITKLSVNNPVSTLMVFTAILLFGIFSWISLPKDLLPSVELPAITVITIYPGASAEDVEAQITNPLETIFAGAENIKKITSVSKENVSIISLVYDWGTNISDAANSARDLMEMVRRQLPADAMNPYIMKINSAMIPVVIFSIQADESFNGLERIVYDRIIEPLKRVEGVGTAFIIAQPSREININIDPQKLSSYKISLSALSTIIQAYNLNIPAGNVKFGKFDFAVRIPGKINSVDEIKNIPIASFNNKLVKIGDVAEISDTYKEKDEIVYSGGKKAIALFVQKQSGTNNYKVYNNVLIKMQEIQKTLPPDVKTDIVFETSQITDEVSKNLQATIYYAAIFVMIVVFAFLREWRNSLIVILTIPFSMMTAYITMKVAGFTINIFSLISLIIAIGMVVDNAIVILENINQHIEKGAKPREAAIFATSEMGNAIAASTLTTIAVFIPLIFMGGIVGILFKQLAILVAVTMTASLITALSFTPMISSLILKPRVKQKKHNLLFRKGENIFCKMEKMYANSLKFFVRSKFIVVVSSIFVFILTMLFGSRMGSDYIPEMDTGDLITVIETEVGTDVHETERIAKEVEKIYQQEIPEIVSQYTVIGQTETSLLSSIGFEEGKNKATITARLSLPQQRKRSAAEIAEKIKKRLSEIPEIENYKITAGSLLQSMLLGAVKPVEIKITGKDFDKLNKTALEIQDLMMKTKGFKDVENSIDRGKSEYHIVIDNQKASALGLNLAMIGLQVRQSIYGADAGIYTEDNVSYNIFVRYSKNFRNDINDLKNIMLTNLFGMQIPLSAVAEIKEGSGPLEIKHESQSRVVKVGANLDNITLSEGAELSREIINSYDKDPSINISLEGKVGEQEESFGNLRFIFIVALLMVYMIMAGQFESFKDPFIILFSIPFMLVGVVLAFLFSGITLNIVTFVGIIMLLGIVVNNGIVLVDYTNLLIARGYDIHDAIVEAGRSRLRPVLMTSLTTILAMIPMLFSRGIGSELWVPLAVTMIGGLLVSLLITLILVPCMYGIMKNKKFKKY